MKISQKLLLFPRRSVLARGKAPPSLPSCLWTSFLPSPSTLRDRPSPKWSSHPHPEVSDPRVMGPLSRYPFYVYTHLSSRPRSSLSGIPPSSLRLRSLRDTDFVWPFRKNTVFRLFQKNPKDLPLTHESPYRAGYAFPSLGPLRRRK